MKKLFLNVILSSFAIVSLFVACNSDEVASTNAEKSKALTNKVATSEPPEFYLIYISWDEWGRSSRGCHGFGLCNYTSCITCCIRDGKIVNCNDNSITYNSAEISISPVTNTGFLTIKLDPADSSHASAIRNREVLYIDQDISDPDSNTVLLQGEYQFDDSIGDYGGYRVNASLLN